jgi:hypothetical protein
MESVTLLREKRSKSSLHGLYTLGAFSQVIISLSSSQATMEPALLTCHNGGKGDSVSCYVHEILNCYSALCNLEDLEPCPKVNEAFEKLVGLCGQCPHEDVVAQVCHFHPSHATSALCFSVDDLGCRC